MQEEPISYVTIFTMINVNYPLKTKYKEMIDKWIYNYELEDFVIVRDDFQVILEGCWEDEFHLPRGYLLVRTLMVTSTELEWLVKT